ncbi:MAG: hypothetical protein PVG20_02310 [Thioalkalispiraceae bacterium]|jgi:hypothetical protein
MADQKTDDSEFEKYLQGHSPLSKLYADSEAGKPSRHVDDAILAAAKQSVSAHTSASSQRGYRWYVPVTLAASLILVIFAIRIIPLEKSTDTDLVVEKSGQGDSRQHNAASKATPELMLDKINQLIADGKLDDAQEEYQIFIELFPDYRIDYQKYPKLKNLSEN